MPLFWCIKAQSPFFFFFIAVCLPGEIACIRQLASSHGVLHSMYTTHLICFQFYISCQSWEPMNFHESLFFQSFQIFSFHSYQLCPLLESLHCSYCITGLAPEIPEDLYHLIKKAVSIRKHLERNREDNDSKFGLILVESRIHRLARCYKKTKKLPPVWK